jgi:nucleoside-triphosphatase THEP1
VTGPDGVGKTRFVIETAQFMSEREIFKDGIYYIDLKGKTTD